MGTQRARLIIVRASIKNRRFAGSRDDGSRETRRIASAYSCEQLLIHSCRTLAYRVHAFTPSGRYGSAEGRLEPSGLA